MLAKKMPGLALVGLRRSRALTSFASQDIGGFNFSTNYNGDFNCFVSNPPSLSLSINFVSRFYGGVASLPFYSVRSMSSKDPPRMGSIMEHPEYKEMFKILSDEAKSPLNIVCYHILSKELIVNQVVLELDALSFKSLYGGTASAKGSSMIKELKRTGAVKVGKLNIEDDEALRRGFEALVDETKVDKKALVQELFAENVGGGSEWDKSFMLKLMTG